MVGESGGLAVAEQDVNSTPAYYKLMVELDRTLHSNLSDLATD